MSNSTIHWHGYWLDDKCHVPLDIKLAAGLAVFFAGKSVADLGCGLGNYTMFLKDCGIDIDGYDGNPHIEGCQIVDLADPVNLPRVYDWILHRHNTCGVVLSWATPGQGGHGHFNERPHDYIVEQFTQHVLRKLSKHFWFRKNIMVFRKHGLHHTPPA